MVHLKPTTRSLRTSKNHLERRGPDWTHLGKTEVNICQVNKEAFDGHKL